MKKIQPSVEKEIVEAIQRELLTWYDQYKRDLPWRKDQDPYKIWVSEVMLQQTKVATAIPYFERFLRRFPTLEKLADADEEEVLKQWEGLGYYSRARNLHQAAREVRDTYGGEIPRDPEEIGNLKGVGPYTKGAILSIAYGQKEPAVDGNVMRVLSRWFALYDDITQFRTRSKIEQYVLELIPEHNPGDFNQALMELGATICTPTSPSCLLCPVQYICKANQIGIQDHLPIKKRAKAPKQEEQLFFAIFAEDQLLLVKRPDCGFLAGLWSLPTMEWKSDSSVEEFIRSFCLQIPFIVKREVAAFRYIFTHRDWRIKLIEVQLSQKIKFLPKDYLFCSLDQLEHFAFANVYRKAILYLLGDKGREGDK